MKNRRGRPCDQVRRLSLKRFSMDRPVSFLFILSFRNPHLLKGVQRGENGASDPCGIEALLRGRDSDLDIFGSKLLDFREQPIAESLEKGGPTGQYNVLEEHLPQVHVGLLDGKY